MPPTSRYEKLSEDARELIAEAIDDPSIEVKTLYGKLIDLGYSASELGAMSALGLYLRRRREKKTGKKDPPRTKAGDVAKRLAKTRAASKKKATTVAKAASKKAPRKKAPRKKAELKLAQEVIPEGARELAVLVLSRVAHQVPLSPALGCEVAARLLEMEAGDG